MHLAFRNPQISLYLLAVVTFLIILLRRVLRRQEPLNDELYSKTVAIEHVQSGVAWVRGDGTIKTINTAFAAILSARPENLAGRGWYELFAKQEHDRLKDAYSQTLLTGTWSIDVLGKRADGTYAGLDVLLVAVHDHKARFLGHYCLAADRTREKLLLEQVHRFSNARMLTA